MLRKTFRIDELQCCSDVEVLVCEAVENVQVLEAEKKIGVDWSRQSQKRASSAASVFKFSSGLVTRGSPKRFALRWPALDKRCSSCYTLRGCGLADIQSREELKMLLEAKRQPG